MKFFCKVLICVTILALLGPFFLKDQNGRPIMDARKMGLDTIKDIKSFFKKLTQGGMKHQAEIAPEAIVEKGPHADLMTMKGDELFYRWQDENGIWQFTRTPPPPDIKDYVPVVTNVNANVMDSLDQGKIDKALGIAKEEVLVKADKKNKQHDEDSALNEDLAELGYEDANPLKAIPKILENTRQIQENAKQKNKILNEL